MDNILDISLWDVVNSNNIDEAILHIQNRSNAAGPDGIRPRDLAEYWQMNGSTLTKLMYIVLMCDINKKRNAKVHKLCKRYLTHVQKSFAGDEH